MSCYMYFLQLKKFWKCKAHYQCQLFILIIIMLAFPLYSFPDALAVVILSVCAFSFSLWCYCYSFFSAIKATEGKVFSFKSQIFLYSPAPAMLYPLRCPFALLFDDREWSQGDRHSPFSKGRLLSQRVFSPRCTWLLEIAFSPEIKLKKEIILILGLVYVRSRPPKVCRLLAPEGIYSEAAQCCPLFKCQAEPLLELGNPPSWLDWILSWVKSFLYCEQQFWGPWVQGAGELILCLYSKDI